MLLSRTNMPIQTATFTAQMKIRWGKRRRGGGGGRERRGSRQRRVKGATEGRSQRWIMAQQREQREIKTRKVLFHLSNYIYLSLAHKQTKETNGTEWRNLSWMAANRRSDTTARARNWSKGVEQQRRNKSKGGEEISRVRRRKYGKWEKKQQRNEKSWERRR